MRACGLCIITLTVCVVPWLLGGAIPHAKCALLIGAVAGAALALAGCILRKELPAKMPLTAWPLLGLCLSSLLQLMPVFEHPALQMKHAVKHSLAQDLPVFQDEVALRKSYPRTVLPAETRQGLVQLLSLVLIVLAVRESATTPRHVAFVMVGLVLSGCGMTALALSQQYGMLDVVVGNYWKVSKTKPFGCFVNPNNAASWLIVCLAAAFYLGGRCFRIRDLSEVRSSRNVRTVADRIWLQWSGFLGRLAEMNTSQILASAAIILLIAGIAATLSRAGIVAAVLGIIALGMSRLLAGRWLASFCSVLLILILSSLFMSLMDLDTTVLSELRTLKDPVSDSTIRLLHWTDSLQSCADFPLLGSGFSAYRCASMPYQRHETGKWFQRADNQYVEVLVEGGLMGLSCFLAIGLLMIKFAFNALASRHRRVVADVDVAEWLGSIALLCVVGLAGAAFFDYGTSLSSVASAFVTIMVIVERWSYQSQKPFVEKPRAPGLSFPAVSRAFVWVLVIVACMAQLPDSLAAARIYNATAPVERMVANPDVGVLIESGEELCENLDQVLSTRPDDYLGQRVKVLLLDLLCRRDLLLQTTDGRTESPEQLDAMFRQLDIASLTFRLADESVAADVKDAVQREVTVPLEKYGCTVVGRRLLQHSAGLPSVGLMQIEYDLFLGDMASSQQHIAWLRFSEPHGAAALFEIGQILFRMERLEEARECWIHSLLISEVFRPKMIMDRVATSGLDSALAWLMPPDYETCVKCVIECRADPLVVSRLLERANQLWVEQPPERTEPVMLLRAEHLVELGQASEALTSLDEFLYSEPHNLAVRKAKARLLERVGQNAKAYDEWLRVRSFSAEDPDAESSLNRLVKLPPTTFR
ncbi:MAG: O-antigen ligase family protein [Planctomycetaceae bacterium]